MGEEWGVKVPRNYLTAPMSVYFNAYRDTAYNRGGEEILKVAGSAGAWD